MYRIYAITVIALMGGLGMMMMAGLGFPAIGVLAIPLWIIVVLNDGNKEIPDPG